MIKIYVFSLNVEMDCIYVKDVRKLLWFNFTYVNVLLLMFVYFDAFIYLLLHTSLVLEKAAKPKCHTNNNNINNF